MKILALGATGSIGRYVVDQALAAGHQVVAVSRRADAARRLFGNAEGLEIVEADITSSTDLAPLAAQVDAAILTQGGDGNPEIYPSTVQALVDVAPSHLQVALMSSINVSQPPSGPYAALMREKFAGENILRASGLPYTVVRPGWFGGTGARAILQQGDTQEYGSVANSVIAEALIQALATPEALNKTFEIFSEDGEPLANWGTAFAQLSADA